MGVSPSSCGRESKVGKRQKTKTCDSANMMSYSATGVVMWECPDFFPLGDRYIAIYGADSEQQCYYMVGGK